MHNINKKNYPNSLRILLSMAISCPAIVIALECPNTIDADFVRSSQKNAEIGKDIIPILQGINAMVSSLEIPENSKKPITSYMSENQKEFFEEGLKKIQYYQSVSGLENIYQNRLYLMKEIYDANEWWHNKAIEYITLKGKIDNGFAEWIKTQQMSTSISNGLDYTNILLEVQLNLDDIPEFYKHKQ